MGLDWLGGNKEEVIGLCARCSLIHLIRVLINRWIVMGAARIESG